VPGQGLASSKPQQSSEFVMQSAEKLSLVRIKHRNLTQNPIFQVAFAHKSIGNCSAGQRPNCNITKTGDLYLNRKIYALN